MGDCKGFEGEEFGVISRTAFDVSAVGLVFNEHCAGSVSMIRAVSSRSVFGEGPASSGNGSGLRWPIFVEEVSFSACLYAFSLETFFLEDVFFCGSGAL